VAINGLGPYEFLVDTGSEVTVIEPSLAAELELKRDGDVDVSAVGNHSKAEFARLDLIEVGPIAVRHPLVVVAPLLQIHQALDRKIRGLLGGSFLGHFDLLIDYAHKVVCFDETTLMLHDVHGQDVPLVETSDSRNELPFAHSPVILAHIGGEDSRDVLLILDSASSSPLLYAAHVETPAWLLRNHAQWGSIVGRGPQPMFAMLPSRGLRIGSRVLPDVAFVFPLSTGSSAITTGDEDCSRQLFSSEPSSAMPIIL